MELLIVEDEPVIGKALRQGFREAGHDCVWAKDGDKGWELARSQQFDAIILDLMLPGKRGLDIVRDLRAEGIRTPVVLLTALGSVEERVAGLSAGADDYLVKPFAFPELMARIEAVCRRSGMRPSPTVQAGELCLDLATRRVIRAGTEIDLTPTEFSLLEFLIRHAGQLVTRKMLCEHLWESDWEGATNVIEVHINRLRGKLDKGFDRSLIQTIRGRGYALRGILKPASNLKEIFGTLRFRLTVWNTAVVFVFVLTTLWGVREGLRFVLWREADDQLLEDAREIERTIAENYPNLQKIKDELDRKATTHTHRGLHIRIFDESGAVKLTTPNAPAVPFPADLFQYGMTPITAGHYRLVHLILDSPKLPRYKIRIGTSFKPLEEDIEQVTELLIVVGSVTLLISPVGGYWLAGRATRPIAHIIDTTARLHPSSLAERLPLRGTNDELDRLSATINGFLDRIGRYLDQNRDFTANAAHELRSPLAAIQNSLEVALNADRSTDEYKELLAEILDECGDLRILVNQLLLLAENDAGRMQVSTERVELEGVVQKAYDMFLGVAESADIELRIAVLEPVRVAGDAGRLRQVVNNLVDNAIKFTRSGGSVEIRLWSSPPDGTVRFSVSDTGSGIPPDDVPHIFDRFYRGDKGRHRERRSRGTGLGLAICQSIIAAHDGRIEVESVVDQGTTMTVILPDAAASDSAAAKSEPVSLELP